MAIRFIILFVQLSYSILALAQDLLEITPEEYLAQNNSIERQEIVSFILSQTEEKKATTQEELDFIWNDIKLRNHASMIRIQIINQKLYIESSNIRNERFAFIKYFDYLVKKYKFQDVDFIIYDTDFIIPSKLADKLIGYPAFMQSKNLDSKYERDLFLLPDTYMIDKYWEELIARIEKAKTLFSWDSKIEKIYWKGTLTGGSDDIDSPDISSRLKLVILSKLYPNIIDASLKAYHKFIKTDDGEYKTSISSFLFGPNLPLKEGEDTLHETVHIPEEEQLKFKYLISLDGNTASWRRIPWIMLSNSILLKQESLKVQWFYSALKPNIHYIPIKENLTDIFEKYEWLRNNDALAQKISSNAQNFVYSSLMPKDIEIQTVLTINEYSKLFKNKLSPSLMSIDYLNRHIEIFENEKKERNYSNFKKIKLFIKNLLGQ